MRKATRSSCCTKTTSWRACKPAPSARRLFARLVAFVAAFASHTFIHTKQYKTKKNHYEKKKHAHPRALFGIRTSTRDSNATSRASIDPHTDHDTHTSLLYPVYEPPWPEGRRQRPRTRIHTPYTLDSYQSCITHTHYSSRTSPEPPSQYDAQRPRPCSRARDRHVARNPCPRDRHSRTPDDDASQRPVQESRARAREDRVRAGEEVPLRRLRRQESPRGDARAGQDGEEDRGEAEADDAGEEADAGAQADDDDAQGGAVQGVREG